MSIDYNVLNVLSKNFSPSSPENSLCANPACHIALQLRERRDLSSHIKRPPCHHTRRKHTEELTSAQLLGLNDRWNTIKLTVWK